MTASRAAGTLCKSPSINLFTTTRILRLFLLTVGFGLIAVLIWRAGPRLVLDMLARTGWSFIAVVGIHVVHVAVRAAGLWRAVLNQSVRYGDVLRIRLSGEAVETLTFTGPFLAEPAKGWLLTRRGLTTADAFAAVLAEYLLYTVISSVLAAVALWLLLARGLLPPAVRPGAVVVVALAIAFVGAVAFAAITGIGLIVPILRASRFLIGARRAEQAAVGFGHIEVVLVSFLHAYPARLAQVLAIETVAHLLLIAEVGVMIAALGLLSSWSQPVIIEGGVKFISVAFAFIPGQVGVTEAVYTSLAGAIGLPAAAGLVLALVRRIRGLVIAAAGVLAVSLSGGGRQRETWRAH